MQSGECCGRIAEALLLDMSALARGQRAIRELSDHGGSGTWRGAANEMPQIIPPKVGSPRVWDCLSIRWRGPDHARHSHLEKFGIHLHVGEDGAMRIHRVPRRGLRASGCAAFALHGSGKDGALVVAAA